MPDNEIHVDLGGQVRRIGLARPAYDLNPVPTGLKARVLTTNINLDEGTSSLDLLEEAAEYFGLGLLQARAIIKEVATATATWRDVAQKQARAHLRSTAWRARSNPMICGEPSPSEERYRRSAEESRKVTKNSVD